MSIIESVEKYDAWLERQLKGTFVKNDLKKKHKKMAKDAFQFLRATYWRWAETIYNRSVCPELKDAPHVLAVGDIHAENFGTWRDAEGRLIWGVNDFDDAARIPYAVDIVRLAASAMLAEVKGISARKVCDSILDGYCDGVEDPKPFVLDREHKDLRDAFVVSDTERMKFWAKFDPAELEKTPDKDVTPISEEQLQADFASCAKGLRRARPDGSVDFRYFSRSAGTGSLCRPRFFGTGAWRGDLIVREAKAMVRSAWVLAHGGSHNLRCGEIAVGKYRSPDPTYRLHARVLVRRLSPNDFKIDTKQKEKSADQQENPKAVERNELVNAGVLRAMGRDLAAIHRGTPDRKKAILADLEQRKSGWLFAAAQAASENVNREFKMWKAHHDALPDEDD